MIRALFVPCPSFLGNSGPTESSFRIIGWAEKTGADSPAEDAWFVVFFHITDVETGETVSVKEASTLDSGETYREIRDGGRLDTGEYELHWFINTSAPFAKPSGPAGDPATIEGGVRLFVVSNKTPRLSTGARPVGFGDCPSHPKRPGGRG